MRFSITPVGSYDRRANIDEDVEKLEFSYTSNENIKWNSIFGKQSGSFLKE
jgi:hypothetical protein